MQTKNIVTTVLITLILGVILILCNMTDKLLEPASSFYKVYLNGENIGSIASKENLYALIDANQSAIKDKYGVDSVYPPTDLKIIATASYDQKIDNINDVYAKIEANDNFTVKGYVVEIKSEDKTYTINVLDKEVFYNAAKRFVKAFLDENDYENYINNTQKEIEGVGHIIKDMYFAENITIKEAYISVNDKIYTDELELSQYLLFGEVPETKSYTVKLGDTIETIAYANKLNSEEFLIANPNFKNENAVLRVGEEVNVTLIEPQLTFVYSIYEIVDEYIYYTKKTVYDNTKSYGSREITTPGQNGINRVTEEYLVTNGEGAQGVEPISVEVIREKVDQITTVGTYYAGSLGGGTPIVIDGDWGWPTNGGYVITSTWGYRWGTIHKGIDISGAGNFGSNIYVVADGTVINTYSGCPNHGTGRNDTCGGGFGNYIVVDHGNGYYTTYAHLCRELKVRVGDSVSKGQVIGYMGNSGSSTGTHLHFAVAKGSSTNFFNPLLLYQ